MKKILLLLLLFFVACQNNLVSESYIVTGIPPVAELIKEISEEKVVSIISSDMDPHIFQLKPSDAKIIANSELIISLDQYTDGNFLTIADKKIHTLFEYEHNDEEHDDEEHHHDEHHGHHQHGSDNIHVWLSFTKSLELVDKIVAVLSEYKPENIQKYQKNADKIKAEIQEIYQENQPYTFASIVQRHPAWDYILDELKIINIGTIEDYEGEQLSFKKRDQLTKKIQSYSNVIIIDDVFSPESEVINQITEETGAVLKRFNPLQAPSGSFKIQDILKEYTTQLRGTK